MRLLALSVLVLWLASCGDTVPGWKRGSVEEEFWGEFTGTGANGEVVWLRIAYAAYEFRVDGRLVAKGDWKVRSHFVG